MSDKPRFAVLGAGNGGLAMAGHLSLMGFPVSLFNRNEARIALIRQTMEIQVLANRESDDLPHGRAPMDRVTSNMAEAMRDADIIMVVAPATAHRYMAEEAAPHLQDGQIVVLNPGRTGGALEFRHVIKEKGCTADVVVSEAQTLLYASRASNPGQVNIFSIKNSVPIAAIPAYRTPEVVKRLSVAYPQFVPGDNALKTSLDNIGAIFHPAVTLLNAARIETGRGDFEFYIEGISRSVAKALEVIDVERVNVGKTLGFNCMSARDWLYVAYGAAGKTLFDSIRANEGYYGIKAPTLLDHRYLTEDVPMSLVPIASLGRHMDSPCPTIEAMIHLANVILGVNFWETGRTVESMGLSGLNLQQIRRVILDGE